MSHDVVLHAVPPGEVHTHAAGWLGEQIRRAVEARGEAHVAVSGGTTPAAMFRLLAGLELPWARVQVDERVAPDGDPDRNAKDLLRWLVRPAGIPDANVHLMDVEATDLHDAAARYASALQRACGGVLDVVHLGLGGDGHTASWAPGDLAVLATADDVSVVGVFRGFVRLTLTPACVNRARHRVVLVTGASKSDAVADLLSGGRTIPAAALTRHDTVVFADTDAAPD
jgi:6-phosphogluconolactonase